MPEKGGRIAWRAVAFALARFGQAAFAVQAELFCSLGRVRRALRFVGGRFAWARFGAQAAGKFGSVIDKRPLSEFAQCAQKKAALRLQAALTLHGALRLSRFAGRLPSLRFGTALLEPERLCFVAVLFLLAGQLEPGMRGFVAVLFLLAGQFLFLRALPALPRLFGTALVAVPVFERILIAA